MHLDGHDESMRDAGIVERAEAEGVVMDEVRHHAGRQRKEAAAELGRPFEHRAKAAVQLPGLLLLMAAVVTNY